MGFVSSMVSSLGGDISALFSQMSIVALMCLFLGVILIAVEFFQSTRGVSLVLGIVLLATGIVLRMLADGSVGMLFIMLFAVAAIVFALHILMLVLQKRDWLSASLMLTDFSEVSGAEKYAQLVGREGITTTAVMPEGHMSMNETNFYVTSLVPIEKGVKVRVTQVDGSSIIVEPIEETE